MQYLKAMLFILLLPTTSFAKEYTCVFDNWKGATDEDASISWVGTSFVANYEANSSSGKIKKIFPEENSGWIVTKAVHTNRFTTLKYQQKRWDDKSRVEHLRRFSFRVYNNGKCQATVSTNGFNPVIANGRWE